MNGQEYFLHLAPYLPGSPSHYLPLPDLICPGHSHYYGIEVYSPSAFIFIIIFSNFHRYIFYLRYIFEVILFFLLRDAT